MEDVMQASQNWEGLAQHHEQESKKWEKRWREADKELSELRQYKWAFQMLVKELAKNK